jgi:hypothetical protein
MISPTTRTRNLRLLTLRALALLGIFSLCIPPADAGAQAVTAGIGGTVRTPAGAAVASATISVSGPQQASTTTNAGGAFSLTLGPGVYRVSVSKNGYEAVSLDAVAVVAGQTLPLTVTMAPADLSSLRTIGSVTATTPGGSGAINVGTSTTSYLPAAAFQNFANPEINDVLQHLPNVNVARTSGEPDTAIVVGGAQPYETQTLIDGHPIALGQYGVWLSEYFPSYLVGGAETQSGPGNTTPFANLAVSGTVNLITPGYTTKPTAELVVGTDNYGSQYSDFLATGSLGKTSYVVGAGYGSNNGPYFGKTECAVLPNNPAAANTSASEGIIQFCGLTNDSFFNRGEILKLKYDFSDATSFEVGFVGTQGGYVPQGVSYGLYQGLTTVVACLPSAPLECNNPAYNSLIGTTIPSYAWYPGVAVYNDMPIFDGQLRTTIGNNTLLVRPYAGTIRPGQIDGNPEGGFPQFFSPAGTVPSLPAGTPIPSGGTSLPGGGNAFEQYCGIGFNPTNYYQINSPNNTLVSVNGQEECFQPPYTSYETDNLYGGTLSFVHPMGDSALTLTYDTHATDTFAYISGPANVTVPDTTIRYSTLSLTGELHPLKNLTVNAGLYNTDWELIGFQTVVNQATQTAGLAPLDQTTARFDPHVAFAYGPTSDVSYRFAYGTSETFPYAGQVSGLPSYLPPAAGTNYESLLIEKNPFLAPERSIAFDLGADKRFHNGSVLSIDLQNTIIHDVFEPLSFPAMQAGETIDETINVAQMLMQLATLKYGYAPRVGWGYNISVAAERAFLTQIPASVYAGGPSAPANGVQVCGTSIEGPNTPICIPYLKGYGQLTYTWKGGSYAALGVDYEGENNSYYQPPLAQLDLTVRRPLTRTVDLQVAIENLLNTNNFYNLPYSYQGVTLVEGSTTGLTSGTSTLLPTQPRTVRMQLRFHVGR